MKMSKLFKCAAAILLTNATAMGADQSGPYNSKTSTTKTPATVQHAFNSSPDRKSAIQSLELFKALTRAQVVALDPIDLKAFDAGHKIYPVSHQNANDGILIPPRSAWLAPPDGFYVAP